MKLPELLHENEIVSNWKFLEHGFDNLRIYYKGDKADSSRNYVFYVLGVHSEEYTDDKGFSSWNDKSEIYIAFSGYGNWESLIGLTYGNEDDDAAMTIYSLRCALDLIELVEDDFKL
jgi:hypothetical protein